ncbi:uncharacterized protein [Primulina eburnea]|uniref:uncharacterized protein n=1 Tax=Primulina eburnea TaxID=1245227 RepID=UPI003C6C670D
MGNGENSEHEAKWTKKRTTMSMLPDRLHAKIYKSRLAGFYPEIERTVRKLRKSRREEIKEMAENRDHQNELPREVPIREHFCPVINAHYSGIARGTIAANNFELKPALINMVQQNQFGGAATSDPHLHLRTFLEITDTVKINGVSDEIIRLRLFPFSLRDQARSWLQSLPLGSITTWADLVTKFLSKYFPPAKSAQLKIDITNFRQREFEVLYEAWERYKELLRKFPNHGYAEWVQIELFYNGLDGPTRGNVDAAAGGTIFSKTPDEAYELLEQMTINSYQWPSERSGVQRTAGVYAVDPITSLTAQVSALTAQIAAMNKPGQSTSDVALVIAAEELVVEEAQYINNRGYGGYRVGTFVAESGKRMSRTESRLDSLETHMASIGATLKILESQVGQITKQLTSQPSGAVQKNADPNMREVNAIFMQHEEIGVVSKEEKVDQPTPSKRNRGKKGKSYDFDQCVDISLLPYPQRFLQLKVEFQKKKGLEDLKNLHSNIRFAEQEEVAFTEEDGKGRQGGLPQKLQDPGEFVVPCEIGGQLVEKAICDSGASVNIMQSSLYDKLGLRNMKPTRLSLQMADKSIRTPLGIVEDVELKIDKLKLPVDFLVLDMRDSQNVRTILGRPFLVTAGAVIDLRQGKLTMEVDGQNIELKASKISYDPP